MTRNTIPRPDVDAWRERYEADPLVTRQQIADDCGLSYCAIHWYTRTRHWAKRSDVKLSAMRAAAAAARKKIGAETGGFVAAVAPASVWAFAAGVYVSTTRTSGRHISVQVSA